jgi:hypothetical protein
VILFGSFFAFNLAMAPLMCCCGSGFTRFLRSQKVDKLARMRGEFCDTMFENLPQLAWSITYMMVTGERGSCYLRACVRACV